MEQETAHDRVLPPPPPQGDLSTLVILLLKGVLYAESDPRLWGALLNLQARVRDHMAVMGLSLVLDEAEGYAFLRSRPDEGDESEQKTLRLVPRRPLSFPVSLLLVELRKKLAEFDASGGSTRLVLSRGDIVEMMRVYMPDSSNETRLVDQIEAHINKVVELGFLKKLKSSETSVAYEVRRILKAFVDAQWLADFDSHYRSYQEHHAEAIS